MAHHSTNSDDKGSLGHDEKVASPVLDRESGGKAALYASEGHAHEGFNLAPIDAAAEKRLVWKLDLMVLPPLMLIYLCNFIDRSNIGNARAAGLGPDFGITPDQYNSSLTIYYAIYGLANLPANLLLKWTTQRSGGSHWLLPFMTFAFGVITMCHAFMTNYAELCVLRALLGVLEGFTLPGVTYILARYYTRRELIFRISLYLAGSAALAGGFGGLLASGFLAAGGFGQVQTWRKIFFYEGILTIGLGLIAFVILPKTPERTRILNETERTLLLARMEREQIASNRLVDPISLRAIWKALNYRTMICSMGYAVTNVSVQGLSLFMPTIIATLGRFTTIEVQLRSVPPYICGFVWTIFIALIGMRYRIRGALLVGTSLLTITGYAIFVASRDGNARYAACFLGFMGAVPCGPIWLSWAADNNAPDTQKSLAVSIVPAIGTLGSLVATWSYRSTDAPNYPIGNKLNLAMCSTNLALAVLLALLCKWENRQRAAGKRDHLLDGLSAEDEARLGSRHPRYQLQL